MARGPTKGSKRYTCRNEACEKFGRVQYIAPWADKRCRHCGSENIEEVTTRVGEKPAETPPRPPGLPTEPQEPSTVPQEPSVESQVPPAEPPSDEEPKGDEAIVTEDKAPSPTAPQTVTVIKPKNGDLVHCKDCNWAVYWNDEYHKKPACHAAGCGSSNIEIKRPVEGT